MVSWSRFSSVPVTSDTLRVCFDWMDPGMKIIYSSALVGPKWSHNSLRILLVVAKHNLAYLLWCRLSPSFCKGLLFRLYSCILLTTMRRPFFSCWPYMNLNMKQTEKCTFLGCTHKISMTLLIQIGIYWILWDPFLYVMIFYDIIFMKIYLDF